MIDGEVKAIVLHTALGGLAHEVVHGALRLAVGPLARPRIHGHQLEHVVSREYAADLQPHPADDPLALHLEAAIDPGAVRLGNSTQYEETRG